MNIKYIITAAFLFIAFLGHSQKVGHLNSAVLLVDMPSVKTADQQILKFQKTLEADFKIKGEAFQAKYNAFITKANSGDFPDVQLQKEQAELATEQEGLQRAQQEAQQKISLKRQEIYAPIILRVEKAVQEVGKENGYTMIFDASLGAILYGEDSMDISSLVKTKLGM